MNEKRNIEKTNVLENKKSLDPIQVKVDKYVGSILLVLGVSFLWPFIFYIIYL